MYNYNNSMTVAIAKRSGETTMIPRASECLMESKKTKRNGHPNIVCLGCTLLGILGIALLLLITSLLAISSRAIPIRIQEEIVLFYNSTYALTKFEPGSVESITFESASDTFLYSIMCKELTTIRHTVAQSKTVNITHNHTYPISTYHLLHGSNLEHRIQLVSEKYTNVTECLGTIYLFDDPAEYISFLRYETKSGFIQLKCLENEVEHVLNYQQTAELQPKYWTLYTRCVSGEICED